MKDGAQYAKNCVELSRKPSDLRLLRALRGTEGNAMPSIFKSMYSGTVR